VSTSVLGVVAGAFCSLGAWGADPAPAGQDQPLAQAKPADAQVPVAGDFPPPEPIPSVTLGPTLKTHPVRRTPNGFINGVNGQVVFNERWIDAAVLPRDKKGIWVLDFAYKPLRMITVEVGGKRHNLLYMYYQVTNHTGEPRFFVPQFTLLADGKRYEDNVVPQAIKVIQAREDPSIDNLYGAVDVVGMIPPSSKKGVEDAVFGVAVWDNVDPKADNLTVFVRGLSDGYRVDPAPDGAAPVTRYKTLKVGFLRRGDEHDPKEREISPLDPPFDWTYR
jgi:hypothetical protein